MENTFSNVLRWLTILKFERSGLMKFIKKINKLRKNTFKLAITHFLFIFTTDCYSARSFNVGEVLSWTCSMEAWDQ